MRFFRNIFLSLLLLSITNIGYSQVLGNKLLISSKEVLPSPNVFIGGIGVSTTTSALLATILGISESNIFNFNITNNNISCYIDINYDIPNSAFRLNSEITFYIDEEKCTEIGSLAFTDYLNPYNLEYGYFENVTIIGTQAFYITQTDKVKELIFPEVTSYSGTRGFRNLPLLETCYIPKITVLGTDHLDDQVFLECSNKLLIYAEPTMETINGGGVEGDLAYVTGTLGGQVTYVDNYTLPNSVSNLSDSNITSSSVDLDFSTPSSSNTIDFYEVYIDSGNGYIARDKISFDKITTTGDTLGNLTTGTTYKIKLRTVDIYFNRSGFSNIIEITTL